MLKGLIAFNDEDTILDLFDLLLTLHSFDRRGEGDPHVVEQAVIFQESAIRAHIIKAPEDIL